MSRKARLFGILAGLCLMGAVCAPSPAFAQYQSTATYVCQTPTFWCSFLWSRGVPNGTSCYCNTYGGPVSGYSIDPSGMNNAPTLPTPQTPTKLDPPSDRPRPTGEPDISSDDCYKGLGNCPGSFTRTLAQDGDEPRVTRTNRSSSRFGQALQTLIDAAADEFDDVRGEEKRGTSSSDVYNVTVVPGGFKRCALFIPRSATRGPRVHCWAEGLSYREGLEQVTAVLGPSHDQDDGEHSWLLKGVEVYVENDEGDAGLTIRVDD
jgi:hypothetical protein